MKAYKKNCIFYLTGILFLFNCNSKSNPNLSVSALALLNNTKSEIQNKSDAAWTRLLGTLSASTYANAITSDPSGNIYTAGEAWGDLDGQIRSGYIDLFVIKYDTNGNKQWTRLLGTPGEIAETYAYGITSNSSGNIYTTGYTNGNLDGQTKTGSQDLFIVKYDSNGNKQWTRLLGIVNKQTRAQGITSDSLGNIYITGYTSGNLDGQTKTGSYDLFVIKYDSNGNKMWTRLLGASGATTYSRHIVSDSSGNVYATGSTHGNLDGQTKVGNIDLFVVKYDPNGNKQWLKLLGVFSREAEAYGITSDLSGNIYTTGYTNGNLDGETRTGSQDLFIVKYDTNGNKQWTRLLGGDERDTYAYGITSDSSANVYITGYTYANFDGPPKSAGVIPDLFVVKYDNTGAKQEIRLIRQSSFFPYGITLDPAENIYVTGFTSADLNGNGLGAVYLFLSKFNKQSQ
ncbi:SBBP repeat-containing protein [Leptospira venezuelensis]|uniref:SBBP repeat-containing protein n=1 Tax=Leptospira venezuelensis TaxID=1958811 RepID=UPI000A3864D7|nr:SBBP repeat-containing protein [Leptospira venezuelensis]